MEHMEHAMGVQSFFIMDENFLLNRPRALQLLERMKQAGKSWSLYVFSSVNAIRKYSMEELVQLGVSWIWLGLESPNSSYAKLHEADTHALAPELRQHGIKLLGSTIVGLEHHTPENIEQEIEYAVSHCTDFHQFMLYTPVPGHAALTSRVSRKAACSTALTLPTSMVSSSSTSVTRRFRARSRSAARLGVSVRLRAQWPKPVSHLRHHLPGLEALPRFPDAGCVSACQ